MLTSTGFENGSVRLEIDEPINTVLPREARNDLGLMFRHAPSQIIGHADIQRAVFLAGENLDEEMSVHVAKYIL